MVRVMLLETFFGSLKAWLVTERSAAGSCNFYCYRGRAAVRRSGQEFAQGITEALTWGRPASLQLCGPTVAETRDRAKRHARRPDADVACSMPPTPLHSGMVQSGTPGCLSPPLLHQDPVVK